MTLRSLPARFPSLLPGALLLSGGVALAQSESSDQSNSGLHITGACDPATHRIVTAASCTTYNSLAPNEFGYANRTVELARLVAQIDQG